MKDQRGPLRGERAGNVPAKPAARKRAKLARAPQAFFLKDIYGAHLRAHEEGYTGAIDSATLMRHYGARLFTVEGPVENIKITSASDFYIFRAIVEARENSQIWGL